MGDVVDALELMTWLDAVVTKVKGDRVRVYFRDLQWDTWLNKYDEARIQPVFTMSAAWPQLLPGDPCEIREDDGGWSEVTIVDFIPATTDDTNNYVVVQKENAPLRKLPTSSEILRRKKTSTLTTPSTARWECIAMTNDAAGEWMAYDDDISRTLERGFQDNKVVVQFIRGGVRYEADFVTMVQREGGGVDRPLRRLEPPPMTWEKFTCRYDLEDATVVTPESDAFNFALEHYLRLSGSTAGRVRQVDWYKSEKTMAAFGQMKSDFEATGRSVNEMWVFHGTDANVDEIMINGFEIGGDGVDVRNGATHGHGVYTATGPRRPERYAPNSKKIILARALPGISGTAETDHCDSWRPEKDYVIFRQGDQLLPVYVIHLNNEHHLYHQWRPASYHCNNAPPSSVRSRASR